MLFNYRRTKRFLRGNHIGSLVLNLFEGLIGPDMQVDSFSFVDGVDELGLRVNFVKIVLQIVWFELFGRWSLS